jgi:hypothetical protein
MFSQFDWDGDSHATMVFDWHRGRKGRLYDPVFERHNTNNFPDIPPDEDEVLYARRLIAQRCLYGVDKNDMAVDLAKLSLWLVTLAKDHAFTFLDHSLRHGDALVGLTRDQIIGFHWEPKKQKQFGEDLIQKRLDRATEARAKILNAREDVPYRDQEQRLALANEALDVVRLTGDACVSAFFAGSKPREREARCEELRGHVEEWYRSGFDVKQRGAIAEAVAGLRGSAAGSSLATGNQQRTTAPEHPLPPFHWEIEFPEVFSRENGGFDGFVGNPPFLGGGKISGTSGAEYLNWILFLHPESHGNGDLVAHFFRRAFNVLRGEGAIGLIATNTIGQGDTRTTGLKYICRHGGQVYHARRRLKWPGVAAVIVSVVHITKSEKLRRNCILDEKDSQNINGFLFEGNQTDDPAVLSHRVLSFNGMKVYGQGFLFDDNDSKNEASSIATMNALIAKNPKNQDAIKPYIGGEELNSSPGFRYCRYTIDFFDLTLDEATSCWPDLITILRAKVLPYRQTAKRKALRDKWWQYGEKRPALRAAVSTLVNVIVNSQISPHLSFAFLPSTWIYSHSLNVFAIDSMSMFCEMQCRCHEVWARFFASSMKDDMRYTPSDCFDTYPFISIVHANQLLYDLGANYYAFRNEVMVANNEGLTSTYTRFHDPHEKSAGINKLRDLHAAMDRAVLEAYGWHDLASTARCEFLLDYEEEDEEVGSSELSVGSKRGRKKPWRLRWPDDFRDEVLARLLDLNEQRHKEEVLAGKAIVRGQGSGAGDQGDDDDADLEATDEETESPKPKKTAAGSATKPKPPRKSKKSPAPGQQEMEF